ncbi:hypothetical protein E3T34_01655 [Cryobacterium sp. TMT1-62]|uniref:hypothetical protein n=1 Tax=unclassified Cryobacterium TaxID=2649013 RepID=UPI00106C81D6|nr:MULTISPECIES: hypothetical protein [unclassified Cryobacterium]TFB56223.1 hypothetical protein E3N94_08515 [Cryobacterium sp. Sr3]TFB65539.1 hypothetical protein E3N86_02330 [Cryobacterium sp. Hz7]TFC53262.1 hypothetical protein E3O47_03385 [Cryobacterium sp. TMT2-17-1]TFC69027.1 hypothetical protein E3O54_05645 [Cryobacterium sp. TMT2-4]TFD36391.1 hypothetical protein E3T34_01655 [Cryobacterium sp. TMT1-62]
MSEKLSFRVRRLNKKHRTAFVALFAEHPQAEVDDAPEIYFDDTIELQIESMALALVAETDDGRLLGALVTEPDSYVDENQLDEDSTDDDIDDAIVSDHGTAVFELLITGGSAQVCRELLNTLAPALTTRGFAQVHASVPPDLAEVFRGQGWVVLPENTGIAWMGMDQSDEQVRDYEAIPSSSLAAFLVIDPNVYMSWPYDAPDNPEDDDSRQENIATGMEEFAARVDAEASSDS